MSIRDEKKQQTRQALIDAALKLSFQKGSFTAVSLREITHSAHIVPAAFYRHFANLNELGTVLVDYVAFMVRHTFHHMAKHINFQQVLNREQRLDYYFDQIDLYPEIWHFFMTERFSGSIEIRLALQREIHFLAQDMQQVMLEIPAFQPFIHQKSIPILTELYYLSCLNWANHYLELKCQFQADEFQQQRIHLKQQALETIAYLYAGLRS